MTTTTANSTGRSGLTVDLSLNIVAHPVAAKAPITPNPNKRNNKYERRRQRGNKAKKAQVNSSTKKESGGRHDKKILLNQAAGKSTATAEANDTKKITNGFIPQQEKPLLVAEEHGDQLQSITRTVALDTIKSPNSVKETNQLNSPTDDQPEQLRQLTAAEKTNGSTVETTNYEKDTNIHHDSSRQHTLDTLQVTANKVGSNKEQGEAVPPSRSKKQNSTNPTETPATTTSDFDHTASAAAIAARAAYMAEFHARPMELDRRAGVRNYSSKSNVVDGVQTSSNYNVNDNDKDNDEHDSSTTDTARQWESLPLHKRLISAIHQSIGSTSRPTTIQSRAISLLLAQQHRETDQKNIFIHSETGSGKTLAYLLPVLQSMMIIEPSTDTPSTSITSTIAAIKMSRFDYGTRCVIICPTRELAVQSSIVCDRMCRASGLMHIVTGCLGGSSSSNDNSDSRSTEKIRLRKGLGIVVATPGRLLDHLKRTESLRTAIHQIQYMILDEVDRLLDSGLGQQVQEIIHIIQSLITTTSDKTKVPWRSVFVSATVTEQVQKLSREILSNKESTSREQMSPSWIVVSGRSGESSKLTTQTEGYSDTITTDITSNGDMVSSMASPSFADSSPKQLIQMHVTCSAKLRLTSLIAFLVDRTVKGETTVVFVSTCASVDYYHTLLTSTDCIMPSSIPSNNKDVKSTQKGIFGKNCPIFKLHGNVPQNERQKVLKKFKDAATACPDETSGNGGSVLFATDVAARGLNLPSVDWIVQFDVPCDVADYVHRAGRVARAGGIGHALLFLLPSEKEFLTILQQRGIVNMSAMSLTSILNAAAEICKPLTQQGIIRGGGSLQKDTSKDKNSSRTGEAFCIEMQYRLEDCVVRDDLTARAVAKKETKSKTSKEYVSGKLIDLARDAFLSYIRAYPTKEKCVRHIFAAKALHLGHVARSFALKDPPKKVVVASQTSRKRKIDKLEFLEDTSEQTKKKHLSFNSVQTKAKSKATAGSGGHIKNVRSNLADDRSQKPMHTAGKGRSLLMANAAKLQSNGLDGL